MPTPRALLIHYPERFEAEELGERIWRLGMSDAVCVSAKTGAGLPDLLREISARLEWPGAGG